MLSSFIRFAQVVIEAQTEAIMHSTYLNAENLLYFRFFIFVDLEKL